MAHVLVNEDELVSFCRKHHIRRLSLFGSALRGDFQPDSDVDVVVECEREQVPGLAFSAIEMELSKILGRKVNLNTPGFLSPYSRDQVLAEAEVQYDQTEQSPLVSALETILAQDAE